jgi:hypothetical protein
MKSQDGDLQTFQGGKQRPFGDEKLQVMEMIMVDFDVEDSQVFGNVSVECEGRR